MINNDKDLHDFIMKEFFKEGFSEKPVMKLSVTKVAGVVAFNALLSSEMKDMVTEDDMEKIEVAFSELCSVFISVFKKNESEFVKWVDKKDERDCENCPDKEECEEMNQKSEKPKEMN